MNKISLKYIILVIFILISCTPDKFTLNNKSEYRIEGLIMSNLDCVEVDKDNAIMLHPGGRAALRTFDLTQLLADFSVNIYSGQGIRFAIRTVSKYYPNSPSLVFDYSLSGCKIIENDKIIGFNDSVKVKFKEPARIIIKNDGEFYSIKVDCKEVFKGFTKIPSTEYIILETLMESEAYVYGIKFANVIKEDL
jgi:hypothetical protein